MIPGGTLISKRFAFWSFSVAFAAAATPFLMAAEPVIGMASSQNGVTLNDSKVMGSATLFEGSTVRSEGFSRIHLKNGTRLDLGAGSQAQVFANRAALTSGSGEIQSPSGFELDTQFLKILPAGSSAVARVRVETDRVYVTALNAPVNVLNGQGMLVAKVSPGSPLSFEPQGATAAGAFDVTGCIVQKQGVVLLNDDKGHAVYQVRGMDFRKDVGNMTHVLGTIDASATAMGGATQVVAVTSATVTTRGGCSSVATALGASASASGMAAAGGTAAGTGAGFGTGAAIGIGVAAAAAGVVGGLAAAGAFSTPSP